MLLIFFLNQGVPSPPPLLPADICAVLHHVRLQALVCIQG